MDMNKWIKEISYKDLTGIPAISADDITELLKTHALVPREPTEFMLSKAYDDHMMHMCYSQSSCFAIAGGIYKAMIEAANQSDIDPKGTQVTQEERSGLIEGYDFDDLQTK